MPARSEPHRVRVSATLDPFLAQAVDAYVAAHAGLDRSAVINEALRLWYAQQQEEAMAAQYAAGAERPPADEWAAWKAIQREAARRRLARVEEP
jgi:Arc/MetJ-type ribon-helix-helix transcriptional regulator